MSVKFNSITSSLKYCFVNGVVIPLARGNENLNSMWVCIHNGGSILRGACGSVAVLMSSCKHVFAILHYIANEVNLGHNKTCTSKKQKCDLRVYTKSEEIHPVINKGNLLFAKLHPEYEYDIYQDAFQEKDLVLTLDHLMIQMYCFVRKIGKNLQKQLMALPVSSNLFQPLFQVLLLQHPWLLGLLLFGILG